MNFKVEICVDTVESALIAQNAGADRVELCSSLPEGGVTPGCGTIAFARNKLKLGLHVIIRPRGGDFLYSENEFDIMLRDIEFCRKEGIDGVVAGLLDMEGNIDMPNTRILIEAAKPMSFTFHRAFDLCKDPFKGLEDIIASGASRLLTSGQKDKAADGTELIAELVKRAGNRIIIMPGSGINEANISHIAKQTGASEFHFTGRKIIGSEMIFRREYISMGGIPGTSEYSRKVADEELIRKAINNLRAI